MRPKLTEAVLTRIRAVEALRRSIPTREALALELGISKSSIDQAARKCKQVVVPLDVLPSHQSLHVPRGASAVDMFAPCSRCGGPRDRPGQKYCRACHAAYQRENRRKYSELTPEQRMKAKARSHAKIAQKRGQLIKQPCEKCGDIETQKHHEDYSKPLEVRWLCAQCHRQEHETATKLQSTSHVELDLAKP